MTEKHAAEVLAESIHCGCQAPNDTCKYDDAAAMLRTIPALEAELMEQARIVGMGAERELALIAERDALRADFRRLNEKHTNLHMNADACRKERDALRAEVEALREQLRIAVSDIESLHAELNNGQQLPEPAAPDACRMCGERSEQARLMNEMRARGSGQ